MGATGLTQPKIASNNATAAAKPTIRTTHHFCPRRDGVA